MNLCQKGKAKCCIKINEQIRKRFVFYGDFIGNHPWKVICIIVLLNTVFGLCAYWTEKEFHLDEQFRPSESQAEKDKEFLGLVTNFQYIYQRQLIGVNKYVEIIYEPGYAINLNDVYSLLRTYPVIFGPETCPYSPNRGSVTCSGMDSVRIFQAYNSSLSFMNNDIYPYLNDSYEGVNIYYDQYVKSYGSLSSMYSAKSIYWPKFRDKEHLRHFGGMIDRIKHSLAGTTVYTDDLRDETLYEDLKDSAVRYVGTFVLLNGLALLAIWSARNNNIGNPVLLVLVQLVSTSLACASGIGFWVLLDSKMNVFVLALAPLLAQVMSLLRLFLQISTLSDCGKLGSTQQKIGTLMGSTGAAITLSYLFELSVIVAAVLSSMSGLRNTFSYIGTVSFMTFLNQMTFIPACMAVYDGQTMIGLHCALCFNAEQPKSNSGNMRHKIHNFFCTGIIPKTRNDIESYFDKLLRFVMRKIMLFKFFQATFGLLFVVYLGCMIWQATGLIPQDRLPKMGSPSSNIRQFFENDVGYEQTASISFTIHEPIQYTSAVNQLYIDNLIQEAQADPYVHDSYSINWLSYYKNSYSGSSLYSYDNSSESSFASRLSHASSVYTAMRSFLGDFVYESYAGQLRFSRFYVLAVGLTNSKIKSDLMTRMRKLASDSPLPVTAFSPDFLKYEQYSAVLTELYKTLGIPAACLVVLLCAFLPVDIFSIVYIAVTSVTNVVCIFGAMTIFTIHFNFITMIPVLTMSMINIIVSVTVCFEHGQNGHSENRGHVAQTIETTLVPVFKGCLCIMVGLLCIVDSPSYILYSVFSIFMIGFVNIIIHHVILFPVIVSLFGDRFRKKVHPAFFSAESKTSKNITDRKMFWIDLY